MILFCIIQNDGNCFSCFVLFFSFFILFSICFCVSFFPFNFSFLYPFFHFCIFFLFIPWFWGLAEYLDNFNSFRHGLVCPPSLLLLVNGILENFQKCSVKGNPCSSKNVPDLKRNFSQPDHYVIHDYSWFVSRVTQRLPHSGSCTAYPTGTQGPGGSMS